jgi:hypothetical protein
MAIVKVSNSLNIPPIIKVTIGTKIDIYKTETIQPTC